MQAHSRVSVSISADGVLRYDRLRSQVPLLLRPTPWGLYLVGGAAGPLGGDDLALEIEVGCGASLVVRSAAASLARRGVSQRASEFSVNVHLAPDASLYWMTEPAVACAGCNHHVEVRVEMDAGAGLYWKEELVLGRYGEGPGVWTSGLSVDYGGKPLVRHMLPVGTPGWDGPAVIGDGGSVGSLLAAGSMAVDSIPAAGYPAAGYPIPEMRLSALSVESGGDYGNSPAGGPADKANYVRLEDSCGVLARGTLMRLASPGTMISAIGRDLMAVRRVIDILTVMATRSCS